MIVSQFERAKLHAPAIPTRAATAFLLAAGLLLGTASISLGQGVGVITGRAVQEGTQQPVSSAQASIVALRIGSLTNDDGVFRILNVPAGVHQLRVTQIGLKPVVQTVTIAGGDTVRVDVAMTRAALELDQIVVTGTAGNARQREVGNSISVVNPALSPAIPTNMETMLQAQATGMTVLQGSGQIGGAAQIR